MHLIISHDIPVHIHDIPISLVLQRWNPTKVVAGVSQSLQMSDKKSSWESPATSKVGNSWEGHSMGYLHCGAPSRARVQLPRYHKLVDGVYKPSSISGGLHFVVIYGNFLRVLRHGGSSVVTVSIVSYCLMMSNDLDDLGLLPLQETSIRDIDGLN
jgi:hypothetical protein